MSNASTKQLSPFAAYLASRNLVKVAIIDDAYDLMENQEITSDEREDIWQRLELDDIARDFAEAHGIVEGPDDVTPMRLRDIQVDDAVPNPASKIVEASDFGERIEIAKQSVEPIYHLLHDGFGLQVLRLGSDPQIADLNDVQVIFLDWRLGLDDNAESIQRAANLVKKIYDGLPSLTKPLIVLMSSSESVLSESAKFREDADLIAGMFQAIPKSELRQPQKLGVHAVTLADSLAPAQEVQQFTQAVVNGSQASIQEFVRAVRDLTLSDFANIKLLALANDGQPLADYMCWLLGGHLSDLFFGDTLLARRRSLDAADFKSMISAADTPSGVLAKLYHAAVFDMGVGEVQFSTITAPNGATTQHPLLGLGDVFIVDKTSIEKAATKQASALEQDVKQSEIAVVALPEKPASLNPDFYILINNQCDLSASPTRTSKARSIILLPGTITAMAKPTGSDGTALFVHQNVHGGKGIGIEWDIKAALSISFDEFTEWLTKAKRVGRMRALGALALQASFSSTLTRIGLPVTPPLYHLVDTRLEVIRVRKVVSEQIISQRQATINMAGGKRSCMLTRQFVQRIIKSMEERIVEVKSDTSAEKNLKSEDIEAALENSSEWIKLTTPFELRSEQKYFNDLLIISPSDSIKEIQGFKTILRVVIDVEDGRLE